MTRSWLRRLFSSQFSRRPARRQCRPRLELLEDRVVPATIFWENAVSGNWSVGSNWAGGVTPGADDVAVIDAVGADYTVTLDVDATIAGLTVNSVNAVFSSRSRTFTVNGDATISTGAVGLLASNWAGTGTLINNSILVAAGNSTIATPFEQNGTLTLLALSNNGSFDGNLTVTSGFTNDGTIVLDSTINRLSRLTVSSGTLTNSTTGVIRAEVGAGGLRAIDADLVNDGTVILNTTAQLPGHTINNGAFTIATGAPLNLGSTSTFTQNAGTFSVNGAMSLIDGATFNYDGGAIEGSVGFGGTSGANGSALNIGPGGTGAASFVFFSGGGNTISGDLSPGQTVLLSGGNNITTTVRAAAGFTNAGTIALQTLVAIGTVKLEVSSGSLVNAATGVIEVNPGPGTSHTIIADLVNNGTVNIKEDTRFDGPRVIANNNRFNVAGGAVADLRTGVLFDQNAGILDVDGGFVNFTGTVRYNGGTVDGTVLLLNALLNIGPASNESGTFRFVGTASEIIGDVKEGQTIIVSSGLSPTGNITRLTAASAFTNAGTIVLNHELGFAAELVVTTGALTNGPTGVITVDPGGSSTRAIRAELDNQGTLNVNVAATLGETGANHVNSGNVVLANNTTLTISGASFTNAPDGVLSGSGTFTPGGFIDFDNSGTIAAGASPGSLTFVGNLVQTSSGLLAVEVGGRTPGSEFDVINVTGNAHLAGTLDVRLIDDFVPLIGDTFPVMSFNSRTGGFDNFTGVVAGNPPLLSVDVQAQAVVLEAIEAVVDLVVDSITVPATAIAGQNVTIDYTVTNRGNPTTEGTWVDSLFLSADDVFDPATDPLIARVTHTGDLATNESYTETVTAPLPGVLPGNYKVIVIADSQRRLPDVNTANNVGVSEEEITVDVTRIEFDTPFTGSFVEGQDFFFRLIIPAGVNVGIKVNFPVVGGGILFRGKEDIPKGDKFDQKAFDPNELDQEMVIITPTGADHWFRVRCMNEEACELPFTITAQRFNLEIFECTPDRGSNQGQATTTLDGSGFIRDAEVCLVADDGSRTCAVEVFVQSSSKLFATWDLSGLTPGQYDVEVTSGGQSFILPDCYFVDEAPAEPARVQTTVQDALRFGRTGQGLLEVTNPGGTDIPVPLVFLEIENGKGGLTPAADNFQTVLTVLPVNPGNKGGVLGPGQRVTVPFFYQATTLNGDVNISTRVVDPDEVIDWNGMSDDLLALYPPEARPQILGNLTVIVGNTQGSYQSALADLASYLSQFGVYEQSVDALTAHLIQVADNFGEISGRHEDGAFGKGFADLTHYMAVEDSATGDVIIEIANRKRFFQRRADGSYRGAPGDFATLTKLADGTFELREPEGFVSRYRGGDGKLESTRDRNNNVTTYLYDGDGRLVGMQDAFNRSLQFTYNADELVETVVDQAEQEMRFEYDARILHAVLFGERTTTFERDASTGVVTEIVHPDGTGVKMVVDPLSGFVHKLSWAFA